MEVFHVFNFCGHPLKSTLGGQLKVTRMYLFLQHAPDKHSNMPSDGTVHELTRNVSERDLKFRLVILDFPIFVTNNKIVVHEGETMT